MLPFEGLVVAYLTFFAVATPFASVDTRQRVKTALIAVASAIVVYVMSRGLPVTARLWLPFLYIPLGYWIPVPLVPAHHGGAFESWLRRSDESLSGVLRAMPNVLTYAAEVGYLFCFPLIPVALSVVWLAGTQADVVRFWTAVVAAGYACYVTLPWLVSRPPRLVDIVSIEAARTSVSRANVFVLGRLSHHLNTFPSGHVAVSVAAALCAAMVWPLAGAALGLIASGVALGAASGRYHYVVDVLLGVAIGVLSAFLAPSG
jgi:hypothetical protein